MYVGRTVVVDKSIQFRVVRLGQPQRSRLHMLDRVDGSLGGALDQKADVVFVNTSL